MNQTAISRVNVKFAEVRKALEGLVIAGLLEKMPNLIGKTKITLIEILFGVMDEIEQKEKLEEVPEGVALFYNGLVEQYNVLAEVKAVVKEEKVIKPRVKKEKVVKEEVVVTEVVQKEEPVIQEDQKEKLKRVKKEAKEKVVKEKNSDNINYRVIVYNKWIDEGKQVYNKKMVKRFYQELNLEGKRSISAVNIMLYDFERKGSVPKGI